MRPEQYLYLVEIDGDAVQAVFSADHLGSEAELARFERELRERHAFDIADGGLEIRRWDEHPLTAEDWAGLRWRRDLR